MNNEQKTPEQWFKLLKEPYRSEAIANIDVNRDNYKNYPKSFYDALNNSFSWYTSKQGRDYWAKIQVSIKAGETTYLSEPELKPQDMNNENRIPFDWEKYQSGEYEVICRNGKKPIIAGFNPNVIEWHRIIFWADGEGRGRKENGLVNNDRFEDEYDLFLIPKPKKFQKWINVYSDGHIVDFVSSGLAVDMSIKMETDSRKYIKTILIEWEA
ncbi:MAG: hypothetical protein EBS55_03080 [Flavobacteriaceae bacterium]|nr:hypothetical protein [Flavobacteriaceae bacterium]